MVAKRKNERRSRTDKHSKKAKKVLHYWGINSPRPACAPWPPKKLSDPAEAKWRKIASEAIGTPDPESVTCQDCRDKLKTPSGDPYFPKRT